MGLSKNEYEEKKINENLQKHTYANPMRPSKWINPFTKIDLSIW